jgi:hypothetical protein
MRSAGRIGGGSARWRRLDPLLVARLEQEILDEGGTPPARPDPDEVVVEAEAREVVDAASGRAARPGGSALFRQTLLEQVRRLRSP